jgi:hypothetical protein
MKSRQKSPSSDESESDVSAILRKWKRRGHKKLGLSTQSLMNPRQPTRQLQFSSPSQSKLDFEMAKREFVVKESTTREIEARKQEPEEVVVISLARKWRRFRRAAKPTFETGYFQLPLLRTITDEEFYEEFVNQDNARVEESRLRRRRRGSTVKSI